MTQKIKTALTLLLLSTSFSFTHAEINSSEWPGHWIAQERETAPALAAELESAPWIWSQFNNRLRPHAMIREAEALFRKTVEIDSPSDLTAATLTLTADSAFTLYQNGTPIDSSDDWREISVVDLLPRLLEGTNVIAISVQNYWEQDQNLRLEAGVQNPAGLIGKLTLTYVDGRTETSTTDETWSTSLEAASDWTQIDFDDSSWSSAGISEITGVAGWTGMDHYANRWYAYRKTITLPAVAENQPLIARIAVDSKYWLWINGELVVFEGGVKRGPNPEDTYYDTVDLSDHLVSGENTLAVLAWYWGRSGFSHMDSGQHGFYFDLGVGDTFVVSDKSWQSLSHPAFGETGFPHPNYRLSEFNVHFDARLDIGAWQAPDYDDSAWTKAVELGAAGDAPWNQLVDRRIPLWADSGLINYPEPPEFPFVTTGEVVSVKIPYNAHVTPYFAIEAEAGQLIDIRMDNYAGGSENNLRSEYITRDGYQTWETPAWINGHHVEYRFPAGIKVLDLKYRETGFDAPVLGSFDSDDPALNELWQRSLRTLLVCMRDTYYDCPDRERAQWWGDAVIEIGQTFYALDRVSDTLTQKAIRELVDWQRADHTLYSPVPAGTWNAELPGQMLMSIGEFGFWTYYLHTGDRETVEHAYPHLREYLELWELDEDGLITNRQGDWYWGDWGTNKDTRILDNCYYAFALMGADKMAAVVGAEDDRVFYQERLACLQANFDRVFWTGTEYRSPGYDEETDDRGHGLAILAGLADPAKHAAIAEVLLHNYQASPYVEKYLLESLFRINRPTQALERLRERYRTHLAEPYTTLLEGWGVGEAGFGGGTINHSWSGGPLTLLSEYVAGVSPLEPAYTRFQIKPQLGDLQRVSAVVPSIAGEIRSAIEISAKNITLAVQIPNHTIAEVGIPLTANQQIAALTINGVDVWQAGSIRGVVGSKFLRRDSHHVTLELKPGTYEIVTTLH